MKTKRKRPKMLPTTNYAIRLPVPHPKQAAFIDSPAKRKIIKAGRRGGKTEGVAISNVDKFIKGKRVLYTAPTSDQLGRWWSIVTAALAEPINGHVFKKNETEHLIELPGTEIRIRGKTAWNADTLRGDYADDLTLDEWQLMDEEAWELVGAPMLMDNNGDVTFIYTPPSLHSRSTSKARDPRHAAKMYERFEALMKAGNPRYFASTFTSHDNPYISRDALNEITSDMTALAYRMEILAEDVDEVPGALWHRAMTQVGTLQVLGLEENRVFKTPALIRVVIGVDPSGSSDGDACGIIGAGLAGNGHHYTLEDASVQGSPDIWAKAACRTYHKLKADAMLAEKNYGGEMVEKVIHDTDPTVNVRLVSATRGKAVRAEPVSALTERGTDHLVGNFPELEDELCLWIPGDKKSPNRMDAKVWADTELSSGMNAAGMVDFASDEDAKQTEEEKAVELELRTGGRVCQVCHTATFIREIEPGVFWCDLCAVKVTDEGKAKENK
jgi:hypothetical protein